MTSNPKSETDLALDTGATRRLYPSMVESPDLRWAFIRKVYAILTAQLLLTVAVAATVDLVRPIAHFLVKTRAGLGVDIAVFVMALAGNSFSVKMVSLGFFAVEIRVSVFDYCLT